MASVSNDFINRPMIFPRLYVGFFWFAKYISQSLSYMYYFNILKYDGRKLVYKFWLGSS